MIYIALFRGINVGGKNIINMSDLKEMFEAIGFYDAKTYIQSGNVLFSSDEEEKALSKKCEPSEEKIQLLNPYKGTNDDYMIRRRDVYLLFSHSIRNSKLAGNLHKLGEVSTVRNWKTINKLVALARDMKKNKD